MKKRRGRRGFWWWSWLLVLLTIGGVVGGFFYGKQKWNETPKEYLAYATLSFHVRDVFVSSKNGIQAGSTGVADANESEVLRQVKSEEFLEGLALDLDFVNKWGMSPTEVVLQLRTGLDLDLDQTSDQLTVAARLNDPQEAADFANAVATELPDLIKRIDEKKKEEGLEQLGRDSQPILDEEAAAKAKLKQALAAKGVNIDPGPGVDLGDYLYIPEVLDAKLDWDSTGEALKAIYDSQAEYRNYWAKTVKPSFVMAKAVAPPSFVGPDLQPFQVRWSVYGLTAGMVAGSLLMLVCWKLFP
ncbi:MAG: hypothetical protein P1U90_21375 [Akkermansiaceae bacterium]|nr:hypothetical protein [Akkermansiaceae bacterium]